MFHDNDGGDVESSIVLYAFESSFSLELDASSSTISSQHPSIYWQSVQDGGSAEAFAIETSSLNFPWRLLEFDCAYKKIHAMYICFR